MMKLGKFKRKEDGHLTIVPLRFFDWIRFYWNYYIRRRKIAKNAEAVRKLMEYINNSETWTPHEVKGIIEITSTVPYPELLEPDDD